MLISCILGSVFLSLDYYEEISYYMPSCLVITVLITILCCRKGNSSWLAKMLILFGRDSISFEFHLLAREADYGKSLADIIESDVTYKSNEELFTIPDRRFLDKKMTNAINK